MNDELRTRLEEILTKNSTWHIERSGRSEFSMRRTINDEAIDQISQAYQEEQHTNALIWYTRLTNDLINDDDLKRSEHVGRILEYARIAAGLSEEDVKITLPDEYIPHDPEFVAEHISPVVQVSKNAGFIGKSNTPFEDIMEAREVMQNEGIPTGPRAEFSIGMPSSVWLARFEEELQNILPEGVGLASTYDLGITEVLEVAKRAARLEPSND
jgi:hypothetical protein